MGDFNEILSIEEKYGWRLGDNYRMASFRSFLDSCELLELKTIGSFYTWSNGRHAEDLVMERLDRTLVHEALLLQIYPLAYTNNLVAISSDHCPQIFSFTCPMRKSKCCFKFEQKWLLEDSFKDVVEGV